MVCFAESATTRSSDAAAGVRTPLDGREASWQTSCARRCTERHGTWVVVDCSGALCPTRHTARDSDYQGLRPSHAHASPVPRPDGSVPQRPPDARKVSLGSVACHKTKGQHVVRISARVRQAHLAAEYDTAPISVDRGRVVQYHEL